MINILVFFVNYGPYHIARVNAATLIFQRYAQVTGIELARYEEEYCWLAEISFAQFPLVSLEQEKLLQKVSVFTLIARFYKFLQQINPQVIVISGYSHPVMLAALAWCRWHRKAAILMSETTSYDFPRHPWRESLKSSIVKQFSAALVGGKPQARYLQSLGFPEKAIFFGYDVVNNAAFHPKTISNRTSPMTRSYFLAINRFISKKNLAFLLDCYSRYRAFAKDHIWDLVLCGDGELRPQIEQKVKNLGLEQYVHLPGFLQQKQLLPYFAHANCFIHASIQEQWGLVVNEAMAAGLPVLVSNRCGCFEDLVLEGINGFGFDPENMEELANLMVKMSSGNVDLEAMGKASLEHIQNFSPEHFAKGLMQAVEYAIANS